MELFAESKNSLQLLSHLRLYFLFGLAAGGSEVFCLIHVDDATAGVDDNAALFRHTILSDFFQRAALCAYARYEQEVVGHNLADVFEHASLCSTYYVQHVLVVSPLLALAEYFLD